MTHGWERATPVALFLLIGTAHERHRSGALPAMTPSVAV